MNGRDVIGMERCHDRVKPASAIILACALSTSNLAFCAPICDWACARAAPV